MEEKYKIHAFYVLLILATVIIGLVTVQWSGIPRLPEMLTFALTVSSLVLALLAIVYAYLSNSSFQQTTTLLSRAADDVLRSAGDVRSATDRLGVQVADIPPMLTAMGERFDQTHAMLKEYSARQNIPAVTVPPAPVGVAPPDQLARTYLAVSSVNGLFALYGFKLALRNNRNLDLKQLATAIGTGATDEYMYGFLVATAGAGLVGYTGPNSAALTPQEIHPVVSDGVEAELERRIRMLLTSDDHRDRNLQARERVALLFQPAPSTT